MIRINLLPQEASGKAIKSAGPSGSGGILVGGILVITYAVILVAAYWVYSGQQAEMKKEAALKAEAAKIAKEIEAKRKEYKEINEALDVLRNQNSVLEILDPEKRLFWAEKLNILPMLVPDGVYLTEIKVTEDIREVETPESRRRHAEWAKTRKGNQPPKETKPVIKQKLELSGVSYVQDGTSDQRLQLVIDFHNSLNYDLVRVPYSGEKTGFLEYMQPGINFDPVEGEKVTGRDVMKFKFYLVSKPMSSEE